VGEPTILAALEVAPNGNGVRVEFTKVDRVISHTISLINADEKSAVLTSEINSPGQPCFTELHQQGDMLFLTGADGPCHWSMSVESRRTSSEGGGLLFDVACRNKEPGLKLSTEYSVLSTGGERCIELYDEGTKVEIDASSVRISSSRTAPTTVPATVRWKYSIFPTR
jgi:hypothetical protein